MQNCKAKHLHRSHSTWRGHTDTSLSSVTGWLNVDLSFLARIFQVGSAVCKTCAALHAGRVYTILRKEEVRHFKGLLHKVNNTFVKDHKLPPQLLEAARPASAHALEVLQAYLEA